jgi:hypothetical protein
LLYVNAEAAMAENFLRQFTAGGKTIDLSQRYATDDETATQKRHERAVQNLQPLIYETAQTSPL